MHMLRFCSMLLLLALSLPALAGDDLELVRKALIGRGDDIRYLVEHGANPNARDRFGWPALVIAANRQDEAAMEAVEALVESGADVNATDGEKRTALLNAILSQNTGMVAYLLEHGADYYAKDANGLTMLQIATEEDTKPIIDLIQARISADAEREAALRSPERQKQMMYDFTFAACANQYFRYYVAVGQAQFEDRNVDAELERYSNIQADVSVELQRYFQFTPKVLEEIIAMIGKDIYSQLDSYVSNRNRRKSGVGTEKDLHWRCGRTAELFKEQY